MSTDANFDVSLDYNTLVTEIDALVDINSKCYELLGAICNAADAAGMLDSGYLIINAFNTVNDIINGPIRDTTMNIMSVESLFNIFQNQDFYTDYFSNVDKDGDGNLDIDYDESELQAYNPDYEDPEREYELILQGDVKVRAFLYYYAGDAFYFLVTIISGLCAFCLFTFCFMTIINRKITYISLLKKELDILSGGQLEYPITISGKDELSELARGIDQMRRSIIKHQEVEQQIRKANAELITSMSHDLRTPLTSLLAFLEIIERKKYTDEEQMHDLIHKSLNQTMRIKYMADQLFGYFREHSTEWEYAEMEEIDVDQFLNLIMSEYAYALESKGIHVKTEFSQTFSKIEINMDLFQRAMDNIYSNIVKYADAEEIVFISYKKKDSYVQISISNVICKNKTNHESTGMGLNICRKIIEQHKGCFSTNESDGKFYVVIDIPIKE